MVGVVGAGATRNFQYFHYCSTSPLTTTVRWGIWHLHLTLQSPQGDSAIADSPSCLWLEVSSPSCPPRTGEGVRRLPEDGNNGHPAMDSPERLTQQQEQSRSDRTVTVPKNSKISSCSVAMHPQTVMSLTIGVCNFFWDRKAVANGFFRFWKLVNLLCPRA